MSKSIARVVFAVLLSSVLIAAVSPGIQSRLGSVLRRAQGNNASLSAGVQAEMRQNNASSFAPGSFASPSGMFSDSEGDGRMGCHHTNDNPLDD